MKILIVMSFFVSVALAEVPCLDVNLALEEKWGKAAFLTTGKETRWSHYLKQMPLYDQGQTNTCFAYSAIQLVDHWRQTMGIRVTKEMMLSSPLYAALLSRLDKKSSYFGVKTLSHGEIGETINAIREFGMCREDIIQESLNRFAKGRNLDQREFLEIIELIFTNFQGDPAVIKNMPEKEIWNKFIKDKLSFYDDRKINDDGDLAKIYKKVAPFIKNGDLTLFMNDLFSECKKPTSIYVGTKRIPEPQIQYVKSYNKNAIKNLIRSVLVGKNPQPIAISYCATFLFNKNYLGLIPDPNWDNLMVPKDNNCGSHASIIMGMKNIGGKCHYLLRNTWGTGCDYNWECRYNASKQAVGIWLEENALINNLGDLTYIKNKDLVCMAQTSLGEYVFEMDRPSYPLNKEKFIGLFDKKELLLVETDKSGLTSFLFGKDAKTLYKVDSIEESKLITPIKISYSNPMKNLTFKMTCLPNGPNRSQIEGQLRNLIKSSF